MSNTHWYIIRVRRLFERKFAQQLAQYSDIEVYLPLSKELRQWSDRKKMVTSPMIPGYLFLKCNEKSFHHLYDYSSFMGVLCEQKNYTFLSEGEIDRLKALERTNPSVVLSDFDQLNINDNYSFKDSVFKDIKGKVQAKNEKTTVFILYTSSFPFRLIVKHKND